MQTRLWIKNKLTQLGLNIFGIFEFFDFFGIFENWKKIKCGKINDWKINDLKNKDR